MRDHESKPAADRTGKPGNRSQPGFGLVSDVGSDSRQRNIAQVNTILRTDELSGTSPYVTGNAMPVQRKPLSSDTAPPAEQGQPGVGHAPSAAQQAEAMQLFEDVNGPPSGVGHAPSAAHQAEAMQLFEDVNGPPSSVGHAPSAAHQAEAMQLFEDVNGPPSGVGHAPSAAHQAEAMQLFEDVNRPPSAEKAGKPKAPESPWVARARHYHQTHPKVVEQFIRATGQACIGPDGELDPQAVANWQKEKGVPPDGRVGPKTLAAAKAADRALAKEMNEADAPMTAMPVQRKPSSVGPPRSEDVHAAAARGIASPESPLPHADKIQASFGAAHDVSQIRAHVGGDSARAMGAQAYATGNHVVFEKSPDIHTAAHEAAHVFQQKQAVQLYGGVGAEGDAYERNADAVADRVVAGKPAGDLLGTGTGHSAEHAAVQRKPSHPMIQLGTITVNANEYAFAAGARPFGIIQNYVRNCTTALQTLKDTQLSAVDDFMTHMAFSSADQTKPKILSKILSFAADKVLEHVGVEGFSLKDLKELTALVGDEVERAEAAKGSFNVANYITDLRDRVNDSYANKITTLSGRVPELASRFDAMSGGYSDGDKAAFGEQGQFLRSLDAEAAVMLEQARSISTNEIEQQFVACWVTDDSAGGEGLTNGGAWSLGPTEANGNIVVHLDTDYRLGKVNLYTSAKSGQAADMLNGFMSKRHLKIYQLGIPVRVEMWGPGFNLGSKTTYRVTLNGAPSPEQLPEGGPEPDKVSPHWARVVSSGLLETIDTIHGSEADSESKRS